MKTKLTLEEIQKLPEGTEIFYWRSTNQLPRVNTTTIKSDIKGRKWALSGDGSLFDPTAKGASCFFLKVEAVEDCLLYFEEYSQRLISSIERLKGWKGNWKSLSAT